MRKIINGLLWFLVCVLALFAALAFPSLASIILILAALFIAPIEKLRAFVAKYIPKKAIRTVIAILLVFVGLSAWSVAIDDGSADVVGEETAVVEEATEDVVEKPEVEVAEDAEEVDVPEEAPAATEDSTAVIQEDEHETDVPEISLAFELVAGEEGEYGELFTINKDTEFEETYYIYHVPSGTYTVTNTGEYSNQFNVYSDEIKVNDAGWEEVAEAFYVEVLDVGQSDTVTIEDGQFVEIHEPGKFLLELHSEGEDVQPVAKDTLPTDYVVGAEVQQEDIQEPVVEEPEPAGTDYVGNKNSMKFHYSWCGSVDQMNESNKYYFTGTSDEMIAKGYTPCGRCTP